MRQRPRVRLWVAVLVVGAVSGAAAAGGGIGSIRSQDLKDWLSYIASDELQGRAVYTEGIGLAAAYIQDHLRSWGVKPAGDHAGYLQTVRVLGVKMTSHASVTVDVKGETRTFTDGEGITLPKNMGGNHRVTVDRVEFAGYGLDAPGAGHTDFSAKDVKDAAVVWLGASGPKGLDQGTYRRLLTGRSRYATEQLGAAAAIGPTGSGRAGGAGRAGGQEGHVGLEGRGRQERQTVRRHGS
jgi:hypothetical protein